MGLFYKTPVDLKQLESMVLAVGQQMALMGKGLDTAAVLEDMLPDTVELMQRESARLIAAGREKELKVFRKNLLSVGKYMDNGPYNRMFAPFVRDNLNG